ncbi:MAG: hypothetical protein DSZ05_07520 [Sulfurospirillum sp.]|nr:MAG: hypothetical protein DSZ05_07520 [Sulfurospirillum sp.]
MDKTLFFDPNVSHDNGTGSAVLEKSDTDWVKTDRLFSTFLVPVEAGKSYTLSFWMKAESLQPSLEVYGVYWDQDKQEIENSRGTQIANSRTGTWEQGFVQINVPQNSNIKYFSLKVFMAHQGINGKIWVDDFAFTNGTKLPQRSPKKSFNGTITRVDSLGNMQIFENGFWRDFFPMAIVDVDSHRDLSVYSNQGFNMKLNAWSAADVKTAYAKGLYTALNITLPMMYDSQNISDLENRLQNILNDPDAASKLLFYYVDNEFYNRLPRVVNTINAIRAKDGGKRPVYMLQGDYGLARKYNDLSDIAGAYVATNRLVEDTNLIEQPSIYEYEIMDRTPNQTQPVVFAEITRGVQENFRPVLFGAIAKGARGAAFWRDGGSSGDITKRRWWNDLPNIKAEINKMMTAGIIQADHNPAFSTTASNPKIIAGTRVVNGVGYIIAANPTNRAVTSSYTLNGLGYTPSALQDFITGAGTGTVSGSSVTFTIPAYGSKVIKLLQ